MRRVLRDLILLYPKAWRRRYQHEFEALLGDVSPSWGTLFDVLGGALKMQLKIWTPGKIVAAFALTGVVGAAVYSLTIPNRYVSTAVVKLITAPQETGEAQAQLERILGRASLQRIINEQDLYKKERTREPIEDVIQQM